MLIGGDPPGWLGLAHSVFNVAAVSLIIAGGFWALMIYRRGKRREAAQWLYEIFQRFELGSEFDRAREIFAFHYRDVVEPVHAVLVAGGQAALDPGRRADSQSIDRLLQYLDHVAYLADDRHIEWNDALVYFKKWFDLLSAPERGALRRYLTHFGYGRLAAISRSSREDFVLLYGSLGSREPMHVELGLDKALEYLGRREIQGSLYDLGQFPGLVLGQGAVGAELFKMRDRSVLLRLDEFEEYAHAKPGESLFRRTTLQMTRHRSRITNKLRGNPMIDAWIYVYNRPLEAKEKIAAPSWHEHKLIREEPEFPPT